MYVRYVVLFRDVLLCFVLLHSLAQKSEAELAQPRSDEQVRTICMSVLSVMFVVLFFIDVDTFYGRR